MAQKEYTKIGGRGRRSKEFFTWNTLWLASDHLLQIEHTGYSEEYKRFYYRDIQSISVRRNNRALVWSIFFCAVMALGLGLLIYSESLEARWFWTCFSAIFLLLLIVNLVKGPSCISHIRTAVQQEELPSLRRVWKTDKALARIRTLVAAAQGTLGVEEVRGLISSGQVITPRQTDVPTAPEAPPDTFVPPPNPPPPA